MLIIKGIDEQMKIINQNKKYKLGKAEALRQNCGLGKARARSKEDVQSKARAPNKRGGQRKERVLSKIKPYKGET